MDYLKIFSCQLVLFALGAKMSFFFDHYISPPLTRIDFLAGVLAIPCFFLYWKVMEKVHAHFSGIGLPAKILLAIPAFATGTFAVGWITYLLGGI
ncbi:hypothetical protein HNQ44_001763 [Planomicrobium koreense]|uniref:Uncharacterized protein n=1 Tax=Planococcus koreensis TaxID=112331 RepID=A0A7W8CUP8_9BACL|nr:hypothetical protein [Planococcus koreensis]MBB5180335.1 hypothetical protein [Planococcus koreensis]